MSRGHRRERHLEGLAHEPAVVGRVEGGVYAASATALTLPGQAEAEAEAKAEAEAEGQGLGVGVGVGVRVGVGVGLERASRLPCSCSSSSLAPCRMACWKLRQRRIHSKPSAPEGSSRRPGVGCRCCAASASSSLRLGRRGESKVPRKLPVYRARLASTRFAVTPRGAARHAIHAKKLPHLAHKPQCN